MQKYQSHKIVKAGLITGFTAESSDGNRTLEIRYRYSGGDGRKVLSGPDAERMEKAILGDKSPLPGYVVEYQDGYVSYSPGEAFEKGYKPLGQVAVRNITPEELEAFKRLWEREKDNMPNVRAAVAYTQEQELARLFGFGDALPPKITRDWLVSQIRNCKFEVRQDGRTTLCEITVSNGTTYRGESSCVDPSEFNAALGEEYAHDDALNKAWAAYGFLLRELRFRAGLVDGAERKL